MPYVELTELKSVLAAVDSSTDQDWQGTAAELPDTLLQIAIQDAQSQVDAALRDTYSVPFDPVPQLIVAITRAIACYLADFTYRKSTTYQNQYYPILLRYNWAKEQLEMLKDRKITLEVDYDGAGNGDSGIYRSDSPLFPAHHYLQPARWWRSDW